MILAVMYSFLMNVVHPNAVRTNAPRPQHQEEAFVPRQDDSLTVLFMGAQSARTPPGSYLLARFDPAQDMVAIAAMPGNMRVYNNGAPESLAEVFAFGGARYTLDLISQTLEIPIDRYVRLTPGSFIIAAAAIGGVEFSLPGPLMIEQDGAMLELREGLQLLDGRRAVQLLRHAFPSRDEGIDMQNRLVAEIINQRRDVVLSTMINSVFERVINAIDSDISYSDYVGRLPAAQYLARLPGDVVRVVSFAGVEDDGIFVPADTFIAEMKRYFGS
jgi:anionic cell wall polymer biosynthesis LytR-Cps2A-Psr (LCP) family protein